MTSYGATGEENMEDRLNKIQTEGGKNSCGWQNCKRSGMKENCFESMKRTGRITQMGGREEDIQAGVSNGLMR